MYLLIQLEFFFTQTMISSFGHSTNMPFYLSSKHSIDETKIFWTFRNGWGFVFFNQRIPMPLKALELNTVPQAKEQFLWHAWRYEVQRTVSCQCSLHQKRSELLTCASSFCLQQLLPEGLAIYRAKTLYSIERFSSHIPFFLEQVIWQYMKQHSTHSGRLVCSHTPLLQLFLLFLRWQGFSAGTFFLTWENVVEGK